MATGTYVKETISADGEIITSEKQFWKKSDEPQFIKLYCDDVGLLNKISPFESKVLLAMAMNADYNNEVHTSKSHRDLMAEYLNSSENSIQVTIYKLEKKGLIVKRCTGLYMLDPTWFTKQNWSKTKDLKKEFIKLTITYSEKNGREVEVL